MTPVRLAIAILAMVTLIGCDQFHDTTQPTGFVEITIVPAEAALEGFTVSTLNGRFTYAKFDGTTGNVGVLEAPVGDQRLAVYVDSRDFVPVGVAQYERDDYHREPITVTRGATERITIEFRPTTRFSSSGFTVTRYETARLTLRDAVAATPITITSFYARCTEDGYPNLQTYFRATDLAVNTTPRNITLSYTSGFSYFTSNTVRCRFELADAQGRPVNIDWD